MAGVVLYSLACVAAPAAWGVAMYHVFGWWRKRTPPSPPSKAKPDAPPIDYMI